MASTNTLQTIFNGPRTAVILATQVSDGTANETVTIFDATSAGAFGVNVAGQVFYPGIYVRIMKLTYDVQDMKIALQWKATPSTNIMALGAAPEDFDFSQWGGLKIPTGLAGATGSIQVVSLSPTVGGTYSVLMEIHKGVPQT